MKSLLALILFFSFPVAWAQDEDMPPDAEIELEDEYDDEDEEDMDEEPRRPPAPNRFRKSSNRFNRSGGNSNSNRFTRNRSGGGVDRLGKTEGEVHFELVDPPKYFKRKNRPYLMPPNN